jgi:hypothetical protein
MRNGRRPNSVNNKLSTVALVRENLSGDGSNGTAIIEMPNPDPGSVTITAQQFALRNVTLADDLHGPLTHDCAILYPVPSVYVERSINNQCGNRIQVGLSGKFIASHMQAIFGFYPGGNIQRVTPDASA